MVLPSLPAGTEGDRDTGLVLTTPAAVGMQT